MTSHCNYIFPLLIQNLALPGGRKDKWKTSVWWVDPRQDEGWKEIWCLLFTMNAEPGKKSCSHSRTDEWRQLPHWGHPRADPPDGDSGGPGVCGPPHLLWPPWGRADPDQQFAQRLFFLKDVHNFPTFPRRDGKRTCVGESLLPP